MSPTPHRSVLERVRERDDVVSSLPAALGQEPTCVSPIELSTPDGPVLGLAYQGDFRSEEEMGASSLARALVNSADCASFAAQHSADREPSLYSQEDHALLTVDHLILSVQPLASVADETFSWSLDAARTYFERADTSEARRGMAERATPSAAASAVAEAPPEGDGEAAEVSEVPAAASGVEDASATSVADLPDDLSKLKVDELRPLLKSLGGEPKRLTKPKLISAIEAIVQSRAASADASVVAAEEEGFDDTDSAVGATPTESATGTPETVESPVDVDALSELVHAAWFEMGDVLVIPRGEGAYRELVDAVHEAVVAGSLMVGSGVGLGRGLTLIDSRDLGEKTREEFESAKRWRDEQMTELTSVEQELKAKGHSWFFLGSPQMMDGVAKFWLNGRAKDPQGRQPSGWYSLDELRAEKFVADAQVTE